MGIMHEIKNTIRTPNASIITVHFSFFHFITAI